jgi:site-specific DNA-cytosine methylase
MRIGSLFSGVGGLEKGLIDAGVGECAEVVGLLVLALDASLERI